MLCKTLCVLLLVGLVLGAAVEVKEEVKTDNENILDALQDIMGEKVAAPVEADSGDLGESDDMDAEAPTHEVICGFPPAHVAGANGALGVTREIGLLADPNAHSLQQDAKAAEPEEDEDDKEEKMPGEDGFW